MIGATRIIHESSMHNWKYIHVVINSHIWTYFQIQMNLRYSIFRSRLHEVMRDSDFSIIFLTHEIREWMPMTEKRRTYVSYLRIGRNSFEFSILKNFSWIFLSLHVDFRIVLILMINAVKVVEWASPISSMLRLNYGNHAAVLKEICQRK